MQKFNISEFESNVEIIFNPMSEITQKSNAESFFNNFFININQSYKTLFEFLLITQRENSQFYILKCLSDTVSTFYSQFPEDDKANFRKALVEIFSFYSEKIWKSKFIQGKFSSLFITWFKFDFPESWSDCISTLIGSILSESNEATKWIKIGLLLI